MTPMEKSISKIILFTLLLFSLMFVHGTLFSQQSKAAEGSEGGSKAGSESSDRSAGFGLQADIFSRVRNTDTNILQDFYTMADYTLTPGDVFTITITGGIRSDGSVSNSQEYSVQLQKDYTLNMPVLGTVSVKGMGLPELRNYIIRRIKSMMPVQYVNIVLKAPAQFNVFIYGGVAMPGHIVANPLVSVIDAIAMAGGFKPGASYRKVELIRKKQFLQSDNENEGEEENNQIRYEIDISQFYAKADMEANPPLQPGDRIYIPQAENVAKIEGNIPYPGHYELIDGESLKTLINLAGGILPDTVTSRVDIMRISKEGKYVTTMVDYNKSKDFPIQNGDVVHLHSNFINNQFITIDGAVYGKPQDPKATQNAPDQPLSLQIPYLPGMTALQALEKVGGPTPFADHTRSHIVRKEKGESIPLESEKLWLQKKESLNPELEPEDRIVIPLVQQKVFVTGYVSSPGAFPYSGGFTVQDYILLAGGADPDKGNPEGAFLILDSKDKKDVELTETVKPGSIIHVPLSPLYQADKVFQKFMITVGWITAIIVATNTIYDFGGKIGIW